MERPVFSWRFCGSASQELHREHCLPSVCGRRIAPKKTRMLATPLSDLMITDRSQVRFPRSSGSRFEPLTQLDSGGNSCQGRSQFPYWVAVELILMLRTCSTILGEGAPGFEDILAIPGTRARRAPQRGRSPGNRSIRRGRITALQKPDGAVEEPLSARCSAHWWLRLHSRWLLPWRRQPQPSFPVCTLNQSVGRRRGGEPRKTARRGW